MAYFKMKNFQNKFFREAIYLYRLKENTNFIQQFVSSFYDYDNLYFVSKLYDGFITNYINDTWTENQLKFFSACLIQSFIALRKEKLIHRDVHFNNLVLDEKQYIILIDFHIIMEYKDKNDPKNNLIGSPELCAPEMIKSSEYDYNSDYYRLGGMMYFCIFKKFPNYIKEEKNLSEISIDFNESKNFSYSCIDFINKLLISNPKKRIGFDNIEELQNHEFFKNFNWNDLINGRMKSPFSNIKIKDLGLCPTKFNKRKKIFMNNSFLKNKTFKNMFFLYNNINSNIVNKIFNSFRYLDYFIN